MPQWPPNARKSIEHVVLKTWIRFPEQVKTIQRHLAKASPVGTRGGAVPGVL